MLEPEQDFGEIPATLIIVQSLVCAHVNLLVFINVLWLQKALTLQEVGKVFLGTNTLYCFCNPLFAQNCFKINFFKKEHAYIMMRGVHLLLEAKVGDGRSPF